MKVIFLPIMWFLSGLGCGVVGYRWAGGDADGLRMERMKAELAKQQEEAAKAAVAKQAESAARAAGPGKGQAASAAPVKPQAPATTATFLEKSKELTQIARQLMETRRKSGKGVSREEMTARLQQDIAAVLQTMNLPQDTIKQVQEIVARRDKAVQDTFGAMDPGDSIFNRYMLKEKAKAELRAVLGEEEAQQFERWEDSKTDRSTLEMMVKKGLKLDAAAEQVLIAALYESRLKFKDATTIPTYGAFAGVYSEEVKRRLTGALTPAEIQQVEAILKNLFPKKPVK